MDSGADQRAFGAGARYQTALGRRNILRLDGFTLINRNRGRALVSPQREAFTFGGRLELVYKLYRRNELINISHHAPPYPLNQPHII
jgi:hypothetical protein